MDAGTAPTRARRLTRRIVVVAVLVAQLTAIVAAYDNDHRPFGFQMFPAADRWRADVVRVLDDGSRVPVDEGWEYRWSDLVRGRGLTRPDTWSHGDAGIRGQLAFLDAALAWVAANTPEDRRTLYLEAEVTFTENGGDPETVVLRSPDRAGGGP